MALQIGAGARSGSQRMEFCKLIVSNHESGGKEGSPKAAGTGSDVLLRLLRILEHPELRVGEPP